MVPMQGSEQVLRCEVAATTLLLNDLGILGYSGHIAARLRRPRRASHSVVPAEPLDARTGRSADLRFQWRGYFGPDGYAAALGSLSAL